MKYYRFHRMRSERYHNVKEKKGDEKEALEDYDVTYILRYDTVLETIACGVAKLIQG